MRLAKSLELMFGIALSTGGVLVLSSGAFAADGGESTTAQKVVSLSAQQGSSTVVGVMKENVINVVVVGGVGGSDDTSHLPTAVVNPVNLASGSSRESDGAAIATNGDTGKAKTAVVNGADLDLAAPLTVPTEKTSDPGSPAVKANESPVVGKANIDAARLALPGDAIMEHLYSLPIGPKITMSNIQENDLASMIPSAPTLRQNPGNPPEPVIPSGVLGSFAAMLAGAVVPSVFAVTHWTFPAAQSLISILATILLLVIGRAVSAYGSWTRRGGFAHAARSDVPKYVFNTLFATPLRLGYVLAVSPQHSPFLLVLENKTVLSMVPNAIERRK